MNCETRNDNCLFCNIKSNIRIYPDPPHTIHDCKNCGKYILLSEFYNVRYIFTPKNDYSKLKTNFNIYVENFKNINKNIQFEDVIFVIGNQNDIEQFKNSDVVKNQHIGIKWQFVSFSDLENNNEVEI